MFAALKSVGYKIITDSSHLNSSSYCVRGAIYVKPGSHAVCGLSNGSKASDTLQKAGITSEGSSSGTSFGSTAGSSITKVEAARSYNKSLSGTYVVNTKSGNLMLRAGAGTSKTILAKMPKSAKVQNYGYYTLVGNVKWLYIVYNGITGFCSSEYLKK